MELKPPRAENGKSNPLPPCTLDLLMDLYLAFVTGGRSPTHTRRIKSHIDTGVFHPQSQVLEASFFSSCPLFNPSCLPLPRHAIRVYLKSYDHSGANTARCPITDKTWNPLSPLSRRRFSDRWLLYIFRCMLLYAYPIFNVGKSYLS